MEDVVFEYQLLGAGFFDALFRIGDAQLDLHQLGDSPDPLEELMTVAVALARGEELPPQLLWDPEDGTEYRWHFSVNGQRLHVRVAHVDASTPWNLEGRYGSARTALDDECLVSAFCRVVKNRAVQVRARYGSKQYRELTFGAFPSELLSALQDAVDELQE